MLFGFIGFGGECGQCGVIIGKYIVQLFGCLCVVFMQVVCELLKCCFVVCFGMGLEVVVGCVGGFGQIVVLVVGYVGDFFVEVFFDGDDM